ncbi:tail fiber assembly protein [Turicimonas muris]|uniref:tail fiber assembly protein n=1 Tax=Turicimonas muris TaxID=1796652 RepID=UPI001C3F074F|nr:tail fiber assembly protein [Turicimonas muris]
MTSPIYYRFSEDGYFENSVHAAPDPLASKREGHAVFIQPHSSTLVAPDELEGKWAKWTGENWDYVTLPKTVDELIAFGKIKHDQQTAFWNKMTQLRNELLKEQKYVKQDLVDGWWELTKIPEPTAEEIQAQIARDARSKRDYLISQTDYLLQPDYPISAEQLEEVKAYRQALRDVPEQDGFPETIVWPEMPTVTALK